MKEDDVIKAYVIGSLSKEHEIKLFAKFLENKYEVNYVKSQNSKNFSELVNECFSNIEKADVIFVMPKKDGTLGKGTMYEIEYAKRLNKLKEVI